MPSKSAKQARLMAACAHGAKYEKCPPVKVAKEFNQADIKEASQEYGVARQKKIDDMSPEEFAKAAAEDKAKREELMKKTQKEGTEMSFTRPSAGVTEDMLELVRAYEGTPPADPIQTVATNEHVTMSDRLAGWMPAHLVSENVEQLDEKQFGAPANKDKFKIKSETAASTVNSLMKKKLDNKEIKTVLKAAKTVKEEVELEEGIVDSVKKIIKHEIRKGEANDKGWAQFGRALRSTDDKEAKQAVRNSNRYRDFAKGGTGFKSVKEEVELEEGRKVEKDDHEPHSTRGYLGLSKGEVRDAAYDEGFRHGSGNKHGSQAKSWGAESSHYNSGFMAARNNSDKWHNKMDKVTRVKEEVELGETLQEITKARVIAAIRKGIDKEKDAWKSGDMTNAVKMGKKVVSVASKAKTHFKEETEE